MTDFIPKGISLALKSLKKYFLAKKSVMFGWRLKNICGKKHEHVLRFWNENNSNYHDLNLKCHVPLLADAYEKNWNSSLTDYGLCPSHCLNAKALIWDAILSMSKVEFELIADAGISLFFQKGIRGDVYYIYKRCSKASNKYLFNTLWPKTRMETYYIPSHK